MVIRSIVAVALVVVLSVLGGAVGFWGAVGLATVGVDFDHPYLVFPFAAYAGAAVGLVAGLFAAWRVVRRGRRRSPPMTTASGDHPAAS